MENIGLFGRGREPKDSDIIILRLEIRMFRSHEVGGKGGELGCLKGGRQARTKQISELS